MLLESLDGQKFDRAYAMHMVCQGAHRSSRWFCQSHRHRNLLILEIHACKAICMKTIGIAALLISSCLKPSLGEYVDCVGEKHLMCLI